MRTIFVILTCTILSGCFTSVPQRPKFPEPSPVLLEHCPELHKIPDGTTQLSVLLDRVTMNYAEYHICAARHEQLVNWYKEVKKIYNDLEE